MDSSIKPSNEEEIRFSVRTLWNFILFILFDPCELAKWRADVVPGKKSSQQRFHPYRWAADALPRQPEVEPDAQEYFYWDSGTTSSCEYEPDLTEDEFEVPDRPHHQSWAQIKAGQRMPRNRPRVHPHVISFIHTRRSHCRGA